MKFYKAKIIKSGTVLNSKLDETWFAVKGRGLTKPSAREFRDYLNACTEEFMKPVKEDAANESATTGGTEKGPRETSEDAGPRERTSWEKQTQEDDFNGRTIKKTRFHRDA